MKNAETQNAKINVLREELVGAASGLDKLRIANEISKIRVLAATIAPEANTSIIDLTFKQDAVFKQLEAEKAFGAGADTVKLEELMNQYDDLADQIRALRGEEAVGRTSWATWQELRANEAARNAPSMFEIYREGNGEQGKVDSVYPALYAMNDALDIMDEPAGTFYGVNVKTGDVIYSFQARTEILKASKRVNKAEFDKLMELALRWGNKERGQYSTDWLERNAPSYLALRHGIDKEWAGKAFTQWTLGDAGIDVPAETDTPIATVDAAYKFDNATDAFKEWIADSVKDVDYSPFASASAMDKKAKELGASVAWDVSFAALDGVATKEDDEEGDEFDPQAEFDAAPELDEEDKEVEAKLDGDFRGHPFRGNQHQKASRASGTAVNASIRAKSTERRGDSKSASKAHETAHHAHKAAMVEATGKAKKYHKVMAAFHGTKAGMKLDSVQELEGLTLDDSANWHSKTMEAMKRKDDAALRFILKDATQAAEAGEKFGNPKAGQYRDEAHYASMEIQRRKKGGTQVMDSAEVETEAFELVFDDAGEFPGTVIGVIEKDGVTAGRAHVGGDGKAMVFVGPEGMERVQFPSGRKAMWSDDDVDLMVETLLVTPEVREEMSKPATVDTDASRLNAAYALVSKDAIMSDDPKAIEKLDAKLTSLRLYQEFMKKANKLLKKGDDAGLLAMGLKQSQIDNLKKPDFAGRTGFADYKLTNNNGVIAATRKRLDALIAAKQKEAAVAPTEERDPRDVASDPEGLAIVDPDAPMVPAETSGGEVAPVVEDPAAADQADVIDPIKAVDTAYLETFTNGTADMFAADILERLEPMFAKYENDAPMMDLLNRAAEAYSDAAVKAAQAALAG